MDRNINIFDKIGSLIPGYAGYAERDGRRSCDKILRDTISHRLKLCEDYLQSHISSELSNRHKDICFGLEETRKRINTLSSKIGFASYGVSSFFSASQLKENELMVLFQIDLSLSEKVQYLSDNISKMKKPEIDSAIMEIERAFLNRDEILKEHK